MTRPRKAVVVGTGAGGLAAAAYLAKDGFEVIALDQADRIGGFLAPFEVDGYSFDPGVHYIGRARRGQILDQLLGGLGLDVERMFVELDPDGFDSYRFPDFELRMCRGLDRYRDRLIERFPDERAGLDRLFDLVMRYGELGQTWPFAPHAPRFANLGNWRHAPAIFRWARAPFAALLERLLRDPEVRAVVAAPVGDVGLPPSRLSALVGLGLLDHYGDGAFYPRGGSGTLRDALVDRAIQHGAQFRTGADVAEILVHDTRATGVRLANNETIEADVVISDVDPTITFGRMLANASLPTRLARKVAHTEPSLSTFSIFLGLRRDLRAHGLGAFNVWQYPSWDLEAVYAAPLAGKLPQGDLALFLSSSTSRDDSNTLAPLGCSTLQIVALMAWQPFAKWADVPPAQRDADYAALREQLADRILAQVDRQWPGLVGDVAVKRIATPLSNTDYTRAVRGGIYGPAHTADQIGTKRFGTRTPIRNLFLAGAGANSCGILSCLLSGRTAAALAAGRRAVREQPAPTAELAGAHR